MAANTYCEYTQGTPTDNNKWTVSLWFKRAGLGVIENLFAAWQDGSNQTSFRMYADGTFNFFDYQSGGYTGNLITTRKFRDIGAWMHIVCVWDSDNATAGDRMKIYINGVEETAFSTDTNPSSGQATVLNVNSRVMRIGEDYDGNNFDGCMSHFHFIDGTVYDASAFGEVDSTSGIWKIKTSPSVTYGNNGFFLKMEDSSNMDLDSSGNSKSFTTSGNLTATKDNPSNNFATWNPSVYNANPPISKYGNTEEEGQSDGRYPNTISTLAFPKSGKWYGEFKKLDPSNDKEAIGIADTEKAIEAIRANTAIYNTSYEGQVCVRQDGNYITYGSEAAYFGGGSFGDDDIFQIAFDGDNGAIYFGKNGTWGNSSDPTSGASKTGAVDISGLAWYTAAKSLVFLAGEISSGGYGHLQANFGNGYFGTTAVASAGTSSTNDNSIWEYDCPTGFYGLNTKNLGSYS